MVVVVDAAVVAGEVEAVAPAVEGPVELPSVRLELVVDGGEVPGATAGSAEHATVMSRAVRPATIHTVDVVRPGEGPGHPSVSPAFFTSTFRSAESSVDLLEAFSE